MSFSINSLRLSVTELAIDPAGWKKPCNGCSTYNSNAPLPEPAKPFDANAHTLLESRTRDLGLSETSTQAILTALAWKKAHLLSQNADSPKDFVKHNYLCTKATATLLLSYTRNVTHLLIGSLERASLLKEYLKKSNYALIPTDYRAFSQLETVEIADLSRQYDKRIYYSFATLDHLDNFHRLPNFRNLILNSTGEYQMEQLLFSAGTSSPSFKRIQASLEYLCLYGYRKGENVAIDSHFEELLEKKPERLPRLIEIRGVEKTVLGEGSRFGDHHKELDLYQGNMEKIGYVSSWEV
ncbi:hypothetical protein CSUB01_11776 [Colletotrichum sublineola]|uniref:Uncharacterized protein n=1 Tax=Colletotrichum sublineola TaxID=1173701 RepID=A0A066XCI4_COLSU|nr:hypothetical protein CSUB01_11776 [Colletotrichum sublineola]